MIWTLMRPYDVHCYRMTRPESLSTNTGSSGIDMKNYASAKAISSDMLFGHDENVSKVCLYSAVFLYFQIWSYFQSGPDANLSRFQGSSSISSAEYFGRTEVTGARGSGYVTTPDLDDVKESVRQGVTKVAGRLSNLASGALNQLQVKIQYFKNIFKCLPKPTNTQTRMSTATNSSSKFSK